MLVVSLPVLIVCIAKDYDGIGYWHDPICGEPEAVRIKLTRNLDNLLLERTPSEKMYLGSCAVALKRSHALRSVIIYS